jgi:hypothetical protein
LGPGSGNLKARSDLAEFVDLGAAAAAGRFRVAKLGVGRKL